jgi:linoleate 8R-lipoxygenase/9,12-octadecadienoate 8-hydroperoxide 8R-isomerase/linoleate 8R-lipoxygenase/9,12-octadecadienoate 8-hydroperoxide 8S-isomerase
VKEVDIVRDVINLANTRFNAALFCVPIKIEENPQGIFPEHELYLILTAIFACIFFDADPAASLRVRELSHDVAGKVGAFVSLVAKGVGAAGGLVEAIADLKELDGNPALTSFGNELIGRMLEKGKSVDECVWGTIMPLLAANVPNQSAIMAQCIDYYLGDGAEHLPVLHKLAHENTPEADKKLMHYMLEGCRLRGTVAVYRDVESDMIIEDYATAKPNPKDYTSPNPVPIPDPAGSKIKIPVQKGRRVIVNLATAGRDATVFPEPDKVNPERDIDSYFHFGWGPHRCAGMETSRVAQTALFKAIVGIKGLTRTKGLMGSLKSMPVRKWGGQMVAGQPDENSVVWTGLRMYMTGDQSRYFPVPTTMRVMFDA